MTGAEFRLKRRTLGLSIEEFAERLKVNLRTVRRWENGEWEIPPNAIAFLDNLWQKNIEKANIVLDRLDSVAKEQGKDPEAVVLRMYRTRKGHYEADPGQTWSEHASAVGIIAIALELYGYPFTVEYVEDPKLTREDEGDHPCGN